MDSPEGADTSGSGSSCTIKPCPLRRAGCMRLQAVCPLPATRASCTAASADVRSPKRVCGGTGEYSVLRNLNW